jgi:hypothetical protein
MRVAISGIWQQKHPTPSESGWEFHWHPRDLDTAVTDAVAALDVGLAGAASAWVLAPTWLVWLRTFAAEAPAEQRGYVGLAGALVRFEAPEAVPGLLVALELPPAAPWDGGFGPRVRDVPALGPAPLPPLPADAELLAHAVVGGGRVVAAVEPALFGRLLAWLPPAARVRPRAGLFVADGRGAPAAIEGRVAHYLARAWRPAAGLPAGYAERVWRLVADACAATGRGLEELFADLGELADAWDDLGAYLGRRVLHADELLRCDRAAPAPLLDGRARDGGALWNRVVHYWGRGFLGGAGLDERLAGVLAARVLVDHLVRLDDPTAADLPGRYLRRLRYEALVPATHSARLAAALHRVLPSLEAA